MPSFKFRNPETGEFEKLRGQKSGMLPSVYDPQGKKTDIFAYTDDKIAAIPTPEPDIFWATYGTTTYEEIKNAYDSGLDVLLKRGALIYPLTRLVSTFCYFTCLNDTYLYTAMLMEESSGGTWSNHMQVVVTAPERGEVGQVIAWDDYEEAWMPKSLSGVTVYTATIGTTWTEDSDTGVKSQNIAIEGVTASNTATVDHVFTDGTEYADFVEAENQYLEFITNGYAETYDGGVTFHIFGDAPTVEIPIVVEVV